jgi:TPR repeat protein
LDYLIGLDRTNHTLAQPGLSRNLDAGDGAAGDVRELALHLKLAADQGLSEAQFEYGLLLSQSLGIPANEVEAARYFEMAARQHHTKALYEFGKCLDQGHGVDQNSREAVLMLRSHMDCLSGMIRDWSKVRDI